LGAAKKEAKMQEKAKIRAQFSAISAKKRSFREQQGHFAHLEWRREFKRRQREQESVRRESVYPGCDRTMRRHNAIMEPAHSRAARLIL